MAGNETNFFIRDVTNGSKLPFRIRPGAPTSSIDVAMLITDEPIAIQEEFRMRMRFPGSGSDQEELLFNAVCKWCREDENPEFYIAGFQIEDLPEPETNFIQGLIAEFGM